MSSRKSLSDADRADVTRDLEQELSSAHPDLWAVCSGREPASWRAVATSVSHFFDKLSAADGDPRAFERAQQLKKLILRCNAHCSCLFDGRVEKEPDISGYEFFRILKEKTDALLATLPDGLHDHAEKNGLARELKPPALPPGMKKPPPATQEGVIQYVSKKFNNKLNKIVTKEKEFLGLSADEVRVTSMAVHSAYVDHRLKKEHPGLGKKYGNLREPNVKETNRMYIKKEFDYKDEKQPVAHLLDTVRRSLECENNEAQENFLEELDKKQFAFVRQKSTLPDRTQSVKQCLVNLVYTPMDRSGKKPRALTFRDMVEDPEFEACVEACRKQNDLPADHVNAAVRLLRSKRLAKHKIAMVIEMQLYLTYFLQKRKICHIWYKIARASSGKDLARDCAKYATAPHMAFVPPPPELQRLLKRGSEERKLLWRLGVTKGGWVDLSNKGLGDKEGVVIAQALKYMEHLDFTVTELW